MGHGHHHHDHTNSESSIRSAFFLNVFFTIIEFAGGLFSNSIAIMADALHDLGDSLSLGLAWYFEKFSKKERDQKFTYGYKRFSLLAALVNSVILVIGSFVILWETIPRLMEPEDVNTVAMMVLAVLGIFFNGLAILKLRGGVSLNQKTVFYHLLEDVLGWVAVLAGSIIMHFTGWSYLDPVLSIGITLYILYNVIKNLLQGFRLFLQGTPKEIHLDELLEQITDLSEVIDVHDVHLWSLDGDYHVLTLHIITKGHLSEKMSIDLKKKVRSLARKNGIRHTTLEFEIENEDCMFEDC